MVYQIRIHEVFLSLSEPFEIFSCGLFDTLLLFKVVVWSYRLILRLT